MMEAGPKVPDFSICKDITRDVNEVDTYESTEKTPLPPDGSREMQLMSPSSEVP